MATKRKTLGILLLGCVFGIAAMAVSEPGSSLGSLSIPQGAKVTLVGPQHRDLELVGTDEPIPLQAGAYRVIRWQVERQDDQGEPWRLRAKTFTQYDLVQIDEGQEAVLHVGEPVQLFLHKRQEGRGYRFTCNVRGQMGEPVEIFNRRGRAIPPQLLIANADLSYQKTMDFHFG
jgi:hypothetical protein